MQCNKCGTVLPENSSFCISCGAKVAEHPTVTVSQKQPSSKTKWIVIGSATGGLILIIVAALLFILLNNSPVDKFKKAIQENKYEHAIALYEKEIEGDMKQETEVEAFLKKNLESTVRKFEEESINFKEAAMLLETIEKTKLIKSEVSKAEQQITELHDSRTAFKTGKELLEEDKIKDAIEELSKVIKDDTANYEEAQDLIEETTADYKKAVLADADKLSSEENYEEAIKLIEDASALLGEDSDLAAKKTVYVKKQEDKAAAELQKKIDSLKTKEEVVVESAGIIIQDDTYKSLYPDMIQVVVKNKSNKKVKNMTIAMLAFDDNGLPIKILPQFSFSGGAYEYTGTAEDANILPDQTFGKDKGWSLDEAHGITTVMAIVQEVEYYDGTKWTNEYYEYWIEQYKEKPLNKVV